MAGTGNSRRPARRLGQWWRDSRGFAAVEMALVMPVLLLVTFGTVQYGMLLFTYNSMLAAARDSSRSLALGVATEAQAQSAVAAQLPSWVPAGAWTITPQDIAATGTNRVSTTISVPSSSVAFFTLAPMPATVSVTVVMLKEI